MRYIYRAIEIFRKEGIRVLLLRIRDKLKGCRSISTSPQCFEQLSQEIEKKEIGLYNNPEVETIRLKREYSRSFHVPFESSLVDEKCTVMKGKVAAIVHIFYPELAAKMLSFLENLPLGSDIYISTDTNDKRVRIEKIFTKYDKGNVNIRVLPNRGRDIGPFLTGFMDVFKSYTYFVHIHSKKSPHAEYLDRWGEYCYKNLLGSESIVQSILLLLSYKTIGAVAAAHYPEVQDGINWGYDFNDCQNIIRKLGYVISSDTLLDFPSSSMFWGKSEAFLPLINLKLSFAEENGKVDGTLAHAVERSFFYICELSGYRWLRISTEDVNDKKVLEYKPSNFYKELEKVYYPLFNRYVRKATTLDRKYPEQTSVNTYPVDDNEKTRINLIVPSLNQSQIFGGIATALHLFKELQECALNLFDFRIIVSDSTLDDAAKERFGKDFISCPSYEEDRRKYQIINIPDRYNAKVYVRKNDIFIATAWWTAKIANEMRNDISRYFNHAKDMIYLIQDYEPHFYSWSSKWAICNETYNYKNVLAVINSTELACYILKKFKFKKSFVLPYRLNQTLADACKLDTKKKKQIIFYGRPSVDRNCFELIVDGIAKWQSRNPKIMQDWEVLSLGEQYPSNECPCVKNLQVLGKLSLQEYAKILNESAIGISLMLSPHPSYPPLEMASYGCITITNKYDNKDLSIRSENILNIMEFSPLSVADALDQAIGVFDSNKYKQSLKEDSLEAECDIYSVQKLIDLL